MATYDPSYKSQLAPDFPDYISCPMSLGLISVDTSHGVCVGLVPIPKVFCTKFLTD